jgi:hypothetical protein
MRSPARNRWIVLGALLSFASLATASPAFAEEPSEADIAQARDLGGQAQAAFVAGKYEESERLWVAAQKLYPKAPTLSLGLARAAAKNGHVVLAQEQYNKIIHEWSDVASPPTAFKDALDAARAEIGDVSKRVAGVVITVEGPPSPSVTIDGDAIPAAALGLKRPVDPGEHAVHAEAPGYQPADTKFSVAEGGSAEAKLVMQKAPEATPPVAGVGGAGVGTEPPGAEPPKTRSNRTLAIVALGVGGVGVVVGGITGLVALGKHGTLSDECPDGKCTSDKQSDVDSYKTMGTISTVSFIVGGVGLAAGALLWFTSPKKSASRDAGRWATLTPAKGVSMTPYVGAGSAGVTGTF